MKRLLMNSLFKEKLKILSGVLFALLFLSTVSVFGQVSVGIIDTAVDTSHHLLRDYIDVSAITEEDALEGDQIISWGDINSREKVKIEVAMDWGRFGSFSGFTDWTRANEDKGDEVDKLHVMYGIYTHGTHVAYTAVKGIDHEDVKVMPFTMESSLTSYTEDAIISYDKVIKELKLKEYFDNITKKIKKEKIQIVNISMGVSYELVLNYFKSIVSSSIDEKRLEQIVSSIVTLYNKELTTFYKNNADTLFVNAAGNSGRSLLEDLTMSSVINAPNVITVASVNRSSEISEFSDFSSAYVDIGAKGEYVVGAAVGGSKYAATGTSMAAPQVTRALLIILLANPGMSPLEAKKMLLSDYVIKNSGLTDKINSGAVLDSKKIKELKNSINTTPAARACKAALQ